MWTPGSSSGITIASIVNWIYPIALALDSVGNLYISDSPLIVMWNPTMQTATTIVYGYGSSSNQLSQVYALALTPDNANLFAADTDNHRVQKYSLINNCTSKFSVILPGICVIFAIRSLKKYCQSLILATIVRLMFDLKEKRNFPKTMKTAISSAIPKHRIWIFL
jgi:hypothetical protein